MNLGPFLPIWLLLVPLVLAFLDLQATRRDLRRHTPAGASGFTRDETRTERGASYPR